MHLPFSTGSQYRDETSVLTHRTLGKFTNHSTHYKVHRAYLCMGGLIRDIYINGIVHSYVCVNRKQLNTKKARGLRANDRAQLFTNLIRVKFKPDNRKAHKARHLIDR